MQYYTGILYVKKSQLLLWSTNATEFKETKKK